MSAKLPFSTVAHFALSSASPEPTERLKIYSALQDIALLLGLDEERLHAQDACDSIRKSERAQLTFEEVVRRNLEADGKESL
jgi:hypothetical protein